MTPAWLSQLAPDRAPPPVGWWPPAPGWWLLALLPLLAGVAALGWWRWRQQPLRRWRRAALRELAQVQALSDDVALAQRLQQLCRRFAVAAYGRETVAALSGERWIDFVASHGGSAWSGEAGRQLLRCAYGGRAAAARERWLDGARAFVEAGR